MSKNTRGVKAYISDSNTTNCAKGIPKKHWVVYYYLLSISKWNYKDKEQHRYVYKKDVNISEISKRLKVSRTTYYSAIEYLINNNTIIEDSCNDKYYKLPSYPKCYANIQPYVLKELLAYSIESNIGIDLLRTYLILKKYNELKTNIIKNFTKKDIVVLLERGESATREYRKVEVILILLKKFDLIDFTKEFKRTKISQYYVYTLKKVNTHSNYLYNNSVNPEKKIKEIMQQMLEEL